MTKSSILGVARPVPASGAGAFVLPVPSVSPLTKKSSAPICASIKRDRTHEDFDRRSFPNSIAKACEKRSIGLVRLEEMVEEIVHEIETGGHEISSTEIGEHGAREIARAR